MVVWKFPIDMVDEFAIDMPEGARILTVQIQRQQPCLWVLCDPSKPIETRVFRLAGTGHALGWPLGLLAYVGTFQVAGGSLVFHVFEMVQP